MGISSSTSVVTHTLTCDACGMEREIVTPNRSLMPEELAAKAPGWIWFVQAQPIYPTSDGMVQLACSESCAVDLFGRALSSLRREYTDD